MALHGLFSFGTDYRGLFPARSDFPMSNIFPDLDLDLHPITVHSTLREKSHKNHLKPTQTGTFTLALWVTEVFSAPLITAAAAQVSLHHSQPQPKRWEQEKSRYDKWAEIKRASMTLTISTLLMSYSNSCYQALHSWRAGDDVAKNTLHISWSEQNGGICWKGIIAHLLNNYTALWFGIDACVEPVKRTW